MYRIKSLILVLALSLGASMLAADDTIYLTFRYANGTVKQVEIPIPDESATALPTMKFKENTVEITIPSQNSQEQPKIHTIEVNGLDDSTFESGSSSLENTVIDNSTVFSLVGDNRVRIVAGEALGASSVNVYDLTGRLQSVPVEADGNGIIVSLDRLSTGIYIVNCNNKSIKVNKR